MRPGGDVIAEFYNPFSLRGLVKRLEAADPDLRRAPPRGGLHALRLAADGPQATCRRAAHRRRARGARVHAVLGGARRAARGARVRGGGDAGGLGAAATSPRRLHGRDRRKALTSASTRNASRPVRPQRGAGAAMRTILVPAVVATQLTTSPARVQVAPPSASMAVSPPNQATGAKSAVAPAAGSFVQVSASLFFLGSASSVTESAGRRAGDAPGERAGAEVVAQRARVVDDAEVLACSSRPCWRRSSRACRPTAPPSASAGVEVRGTWCPGRERSSSVDGGAPNSPRNSGAPHGGAVRGHEAERLVGLAAAPAVEEIAAPDRSSAASRPRCRRWARAAASRRPPLVSIAGREEQDGRGIGGADGRRRQLVERADLRGLVAVGLVEEVVADARPARRPARGHAADHGDESVCSRRSCRSRTRPRRRARRRRPSTMAPQLAQAAPLSGAAGVTVGGMAHCGKPSPQPLTR